MDYNFEAPVRPLLEFWQATVTDVVFSKFQVSLSLEIPSQIYGSNSYIQVS